MRAYIRSIKIYWAMLSRGFGEFPKAEKRIKPEALILSVITLGVVLL